MFKNPSNENKSPKQLHEQKVRSGNTPASTKSNSMHVLPFGAALLLHVAPKNTQTLFSYRNVI